MGVLLADEIQSDDIVMADMQFVSDILRHWVVNIRAKFAALCLIS